MISADACYGQITHSSVEHPGRGIMSFIEKLPRRQIIAIRVGVAAVCILVGLLLIAFRGDEGAVMLGVGGILTVFGPMMSWNIGEPNRNKRRRPTR